jgi:riboflavin kinase/FMN adenylyltransferase
MRTVVTVGSFDGVHLGHRAVLEEIARRASAAGLTSMLVTFEPHPLEVINPRAAPQLLTLPDEKAQALAQSPVDSVVFLPFTEELRRLSPERFVEEILERRFNVGELVIGYDHGFGSGRSGDVGLLREIGRRDGFAVDVVAAVELTDGRPISSSLIRRAVAGGDLETAERALGRPYSVSGVVARGVGRGRTIGIPTINLAAISGRKLLPPDGVYAATVSTRRGRYGAMANLGGRPTFGDDARILEAHLFEFDAELYGQPVQLDFIERLRDVVRFATPEELVAQLGRDRAAALAALRKRPGLSTL